MKVDNNSDLNKKCEEALIKRALGYEYEETEIIATKDGKTTKIKKTKKVVPPDITAIIFLLKNKELE